MLVWPSVALLLLLLLCAAPAQPTTAAAASQDDNDDGGSDCPEFEEMAAWIRTNGGQVNVDVRQTPDKGRYVVAPRPFKKGELLAAIPKRLCPETGQGDAAPAYLWADIADPVASRFGPYLDTLPPRGRVFSYYDFPASYRPLIQHAVLEDVITTIQSELQQVWDEQGHLFKKALGDSLTLEDIRYASTLLETRAFYLREAGDRLLPVVDMANHVNGCPHRLMSPFSTGPCPGSPKKKSDCILWTAHADVAAGQEVCNAYSDLMLQDRALLQYGFVQDGAVSLELSGIDRHDFDPEDPWRDPPLSKNGKHQKFRGTKAQMRSEVERLAAILAGLQAFDASPEAAAVTADPERDASGFLLSQVWRWRRQRQAALQREMARLEKAASGQGKGKARRKGVGTGSTASSGGSSSGVAEAASDSDKSEL